MIDFASTRAGYRITDEVAKRDERKRKLTAEQTALWSLKRELPMFIYSLVRCLLYVTGEGIDLFAAYICRSLKPTMEIPGSDSLERLQGLHRDLISLSESCLPNIERLWLELDSRVEEFRKLLDKKPKNESSRQSLSSGNCAFIITAQTYFVGCIALNQLNHL